MKVWLVMQGAAVLGVYSTSDLASGFAERFNGRPKPSYVVAEVREYTVDVDNLPWWWGEM